MRKRTIIFLFIFISVIIIFSLLAVNFLLKPKRRISKYNLDKIVSEKIYNLQRIDDDIYFYNKEKKTFNRLIKENNYNQTAVVADNLDNVLEIKLSPEKNKIFYQNFDNKNYVLDLQTYERLELPEFISSPIIWFKKDGIEGLIYGHRSETLTLNSIDFYDLNSKKNEVLIELFAEEGYPMTSSRVYDKIIFYKFGKEETEERPPSPNEEFFDEVFPARENFVIYDLREKRELLKSEDYLRANFFAQDKKVLLESAGVPFSTFSVFHLEKKIIQPLNIKSRFNKIGLSNSDLIYFGQIERMEDQHTMDSIWQINTVDNKYTEMVLLEKKNPIDVQEIIVSQDGKSIYIINAYDEGLYLLQI